MNTLRRKMARLQRREVCSSVGSSLVRRPLTTLEVLGVLYRFRMKLYGESPPNGNCLEPVRAQAFTAQLDD
jgi:hypothetical protein